MRGRSGCALAVFFERNHVATLWVNLVAPRFPPWMCVARE